MRSNRRVKNANGRSHRIGLGEDAGNTLTQRTPSPGDPDRSLVDDELLKGAWNITPTLSAINRGLSSKTR